MPTHLGLPKQTQDGGFIGEAMGGPVPRVCYWSPTDKSSRVAESVILASSAAGLGSSSGSSIFMSSGMAAGVAPEGLYEWCSGGSSEELLVESPKPRSWMRSQTKVQRMPWRQGCQH